MFFASRLMAAALALLAKSGALDPGPPFKTVAEMSGANSSIESPRVVAITSDADWAQLWHEHHSTFQLHASASAQDEDLDRPKVDFSKVAVLCLFGCESKNVGAFRVSNSGTQGDLAYIQIEPNLLPASGTTILQNPFIFIEVTKTKRKIVVQLDQVPLGGEGWRTLATFGPMKD